MSIKSPKMTPTRIGTGVPAKTGTGYTAASGSGYSTAYAGRRMRNKTDWAGIGLGDAFKPYLEYSIRLPAQRLFYDRVRSVQRTAALQAGESSLSSYAAKTKAQLGPCYTSYPGGQAAYAALGLTAYLEFETLASEKILLVHLAGYLDNPAEHDAVDANQDAYKYLAKLAAVTVQHRLLLEDLSRNPDLAVIEMYRLFLASHLYTGFHTVGRILEAVVLFGDLLPAWDDVALHPLTRVILGKLTEASRYYESVLADANTQQLLSLGKAWVRDLCLAMVDHLPPEKEGGAEVDPKQLLRPYVDHYPDNADPAADEEGDISVPPLSEPKHPSLFDPSTLIETLTENVFQSMSPHERKFSALMSHLKEPVPEFRRHRTLAEFVSAMEAAGSQAGKWEDLRSDLLEDMLRSSMFRAGPIEGVPVSGHEVNVQAGGREGYKGEIFDRPVQLSDDLDSYERLLRDSDQITRAMRTALYPNTNTFHLRERMKTSGALDPARLPLAGITDTVFKRYRVEQKADRRGCPTLVIACDGSGSLNRSQMKMVKILTAAWLNSTLKTDIQVLACLYHSGQIRPGLTGPLVQWIWHPRKTPTVRRADASRCITSLPDTGTGVQSDALSLAFIMEEARRLSAGRMIYLVHITDCAWNLSFQSSEDGKTEMKMLYETLIRDFRGRLHTTLVALGVADKTGFENLLDRVLIFSKRELTEPESVARKIGTYTASIIRERKRISEKT